MNQSNTFPVQSLPHIWHFGHITSSLDIANRLAASQKLSVWDSVLARSQGAGRGQLRRSWFSPEGNVYAALRLPMSPPFSTQAAAPATGCLLALAFERLGLQVSLKWPNDIVLQVHGRPKKFAGILLEERAGVLLAGIGINFINSPPKETLREGSALEATSLQCAAPAFATRYDGGGLLWLSLVKQAISIYNTHDFLYQWPSLAERFLLWRHCLVQICDGHQAARGRLEGVNSLGELVLASNGIQQLCHSGSLDLAD